MALNVEDLSFAELDPAGRRALCNALVKHARREVRDGRERGVGPEELLASFAGSFDSMIKALSDGAIPDDVPLAVVALGGYGRGEVYPFSDIDLLVLHQDVDEQTLDSVVQHVIYPLWDAGVSVGHAVRGIDEALDLAASDLAMQTALLDARHVAGDEGPFHALSAGAYREFFGPQKVNRFVAQLAEERARRHARFGETVYLLEPNVKSNKGGLRDINTALWAAKARFGVADFDELTEVAAATPRQVAALIEAHDFIRGLRLAMHLATSRMQDRLSFELQEQLGPQMFPASEIPGGPRATKAVAPSVERLMHALYRHLRTVVLESEGLLERCCVPEATSPRPPRVDPIDDNFIQVDGWLASQKPELFWERPAELMRAFEVALDQRLRLDRSTRDAIAEAAAAEPGAQLCADASAAERFLSLLQRPDNAGALQEMHDLGLIAALIPEFAPCTGRVQHDLYHVYTVDQHTLLVVDLLHALARGELADHYDRPVDVIRELARPRTLYLAALLHDVAKPLGSRHSEKGARLAAGVAARLGLNHDEQDDVAFLVREHLVMAHISQRRDLSDPEVIRGFVELVGDDAQLLRQLYLLTVADTAMTRPGNLTDWKASLLDDLYTRALASIEHGEGADAAHAAELEKRRDALEEHLERDEGEKGRRLARRLPERLIGSRGVDALRHQLKAVLELEAASDEPVRVITREHELAFGAGDLHEAKTTPDSPVYEVTVACEDRPGLLAMIAGVMLAQRIEVLSAQVHTFDPDPEHALPGGVLDIFLTRPPLGDAAGAIGRFRDQLAQALAGELALDEIVATATRRPNLPGRVLPSVSTQVTFDNEGSREYTILELQAPDRLGLLYVITHELALMGIEVQLAMISTESGRVVDSFYVRDGQTRGKIDDDARGEEIARRLAKAVEALGDM